MNTLKTIENRVYDILSKYPDTRNNDMLLYLLVSKSYIYETHKLEAITFEEVMMNYAVYGIPCFESIRRTRQKIQANHPELSCSPIIRRARHKMQHVYSAYATED